MCPVMFVPARAFVRSGAETPFESAENPAPSNVPLNDARCLHKAPWATAMQR